MGYYMGDYFPNHQRSRMMKGDPGFFSFLGGIAKSALGFVPGVGPILSKAAGAIIPAAGALGRVRPAISAVGRGILKHPGLSAAGAAGVIGAAGVGLHALRGHPAAMMGGMRKRRRMRVTNPKALRRALRRADGFARFAMHCIRLTHPHKKGKFGGFRMKRRKKALG